MDETIWNKSWKECSELGLSDKAIEVLEKEEICTLAEFALVNPEDLRELRKEELSMGSANKMKYMVDRYSAGTNMKTKSAVCGNDCAMEDSDINRSVAGWSTQITWKTQRRCSNKCTNT